MYGQYQYQLYRKFRELRWMSRRPRAQVRRDIDRSHVKILLTAAGRKPVKEDLRERCLYIDLNATMAPEFAECGFGLPLGCTEFQIFGVRC
jgi:hypothetical protein